MLIELNGMEFHLHLSKVEGPQPYRAEIVDEAYVFNVARRDVSTLDCVGAFVKDYTGIQPNASLLGRIAKRLTALRSNNPGSVAAVTVASKVA